MQELLLIAGIACIGLAVYFTRRTKREIDQFLNFGVSADEDLL